MGTSPRKEKDSPLFTLAYEQAPPEVAPVEHEHLSQAFIFIALLMHGAFQRQSNLTLRRDKVRKAPSGLLTASCSSLLLGLSKPSSKISSVVGSLAWDADDLEGELCLGAGVGATQKPGKKRGKYGQYLHSYS